MDTTTRPKGLNELVRLDILAGAWMPGDRLQPTLLAERYGVSTTVIREALTRLAGEKLVEMEPNRGFFVQRLSLSALRDLTELRCRSEALAIELAIERGGLQWQSELIAAHFILSQTPRRGENDPKHVDEEWAVVHRAFHSKLVDGAGMSILTDLARQLSDSTELYRRWAAPSVAAEQRDVEAEHREILEAVLARDAELATRLLRTHYERTVDVVLHSGLTEEVVSD